MAISIVGGAGRSYEAGVSERNRLLTEAIERTELHEAVHKGDGYNINTGVVTLTDAAETPMLYFKNLEDKSFHMTSIIVGTRSSTGGATTEVDIMIVRNPSAGTITSGSDVDILTNRNFGSAKTVSSTAKKGATGLTMTGGTDHIFAYGTTSSRTVIPVEEVIPKDKSLGVKIPPPASNTSMNCYVAIVGYLEEDNQ